MSNDKTRTIGKILVIGPPGSGKSFISRKLRELRHNAVDADTVKGLSKWVDTKGNRVDFPENAGKEWLRSHRFVWDRGFLKSYLKEESPEYLFGVSDNVLDMIDLFDNAYILDVSPDLIRERMKDGDRLNPMGKTSQQVSEIITQMETLVENARSLGLEFIDSSLPLEEILEEIGK